MAPKKAGGKDAKKGGKDPKKPAKSGSSSGGKQKKKKWSKGKVREKLSNMVMWDKVALDKLTAEVPKYKVITIAIVSDRLKVNGSCARAALRYLHKQGLITPVSSGGCDIYTRAAAEAKAEEVKGKKGDKPAADAGEKGKKADKPEAKEKPQKKGAKAAAEAAE